MVGVRVQNLHKSYPLPGGRSRVALRGMDLEIREGEFVCILGPSGCGKSTLLNILSGLDREYEGRVEFIPTQRGTGGGPVVTSYMFQDGRLLPWLTVRENLRFVLDGHRHSAEASGRIDAWLDRVGLADHADDYPLQLSIGMQQRVAVARALIIEPEVLLLDEPFRSLDELTALHMRKELLELWEEQGCTVIFVTHDPLEVVYLADRGILMTPGPGRILEELPIDTFLPRPREIDDPRLWDASRQLAGKLMATVSPHAEVPR